MPLSRLGETTADIKKRGPSLPINITKQITTSPKPESSEVIPSESPQVAYALLTSKRIFMN